MKKQIPVGIVICSICILIAAFMPWGSFEATPKFDVSFIKEMAMPEFGKMTLTMNGWNGSLTLWGLTIPNWIEVVIGVAIAAFSTLDALSIWSSPKPTNFVLCGYGVLHALLISIFLIGNGRINIGTLLTLGSFIALNVILITGALNKDISVIDARAEAR